MAALVATVKGRLQLVIGDGEPIELGGIEIPVTAESVGKTSGELMLKATPNMREVREFFEQVFGAELEHRAAEAERTAAEKGTE
jgi:hypothetical protein